MLSQVEQLRTQPQLLQPSTWISLPVVPIQTLLKLLFVCCWYFTRAVLFGVQGTPPLEAAVMKGVTLTPEVDLRSLGDHEGSLLVAALTAAGSPQAVLWAPKLRQSKRFIAALTKLDGRALRYAASSVQKDGRLRKMAVCYSLDDPWHDELASRRAFFYSPSKACGPKSWGLPHFGTGPPHQLDVLMNDLAFRVNLTVLPGSVPKSCNHPPFGPPA